MQNYKLALDSAKLTIHKSGELITLRTAERDLKAYEAIKWQELYNITKNINKQSISDLKLKNRRITLIALGEAILIGLLIF